LVHLARRAGFTVQRAECARGEGFTTWRNRLIRIRPEASPEHAVLALAHQLAHVLLHGRIAHLELSRTVPCHGIRKVEADSVAFLVAIHLGIDPGLITFPNVSSWAGTDPRARPGATVQAVGDRIADAAARIISRLDEALPPAAALPDRAPLPREDLVRIHQDAARYFQSQLAGSWVPGYLAGRGFGPELLARWQVGYAPARWSALTGHLNEIGYCDAIIEAAGLGHRSSRGTLIDSFRDRAMLPIRSASGIVVAFIGRAARNAGDGVPKYLNSPATGLYNKSEVLFGLWEASGALEGGARPVIVEGPLDAMAVSIAGKGRFVGVASCGTALTARHVAALDTVASLASVGVLAAFDGDQAGRRAAVKTYHLLTPVTSEVDATVFPRGQDPAQLLAEHGPRALAAVLTGEIRPLADLVVDAELDRWSRWLPHAEGRINALRAAAPLIAAMPPGHVGRQIARLADRLELSYATVTEAITDALPGVIARASAEHNLRGPPTHAPSLAQRDFPPSAHRADAAGPDQARTVPGSRMPLPSRCIPR
jgi:DNA primase catalytic core